MDWPLLALFGLFSSFCFYPIVIARFIQLLETSFVIFSGCWAWINLFCWWGVLSDCGEAISIWWENLSWYSSWAAQNQKGWEYGQRKKGNEYGRASQTFICSQQMLQSTYVCEKSLSASLDHQIESSAQDSPPACLWLSSIDSAASYYC